MSFLTSLRLQPRPRAAQVLLITLTMAILLSSQAAFAYQFFQIRSGSSWLVVKWRTIPIRLTVDNGPASILTDVQTAVSTWNTVTTAKDIFGTVSLATVAGAAVDYTGANYATPNGWGNLTGDGRQEVVFDEDGTAFEAAGLDPSSVNGFGPTRMEIVGGEGTITDGYLLINGTRTNFDRLSTMVHELGHVIGLAHSSVGMYNSGSVPSDALLPVSVSRVPTMHPFSVSGTGRRSLEADDIAGVSELYPEATFSTLLGSITGTVTRCHTNEPVLGVNVRAIRANDSSVQVSRYTAFDGNAAGRFTIRGLPAGDYRVVIEGMGANRFSPGRMAMVSTVESDFPTEHLNVADESGCIEATPDAPANVAVAAGGTVSNADLKVSQVQLAFVVDDTGSMSPEIAEVRNALSRTVTRLQSGITSTAPFPRTAIVTFKDNVTTRIISNDPAVLQASIASMFASGGGDCPESSNAALLVASRLLQRGGDAILFTDADSRSDGPDRGTVNSAFREKGLRLSTLLSGSCSSIAADGALPGMNAWLSQNAPGLSDERPMTATAGDEYAGLPTLGPESSVRTFSEISAETGGLFAAIPEVKGSSVDAKTRYANVATNVSVSTVIPAVALVTSGAIPRGARLTTVIVGSNTNFKTGSVITIAGGGVTILSKSVQSPTRLLVDLLVDGGASLGFRDVTVTTDLGAGTIEQAVGGGSVLITAAPTNATVTGVAPAEAAQGRSLSINVYGFNTSFTNASVVSFGSGVTVNSVLATSGTSLVANVTVDPAASIGYRNVTVTTGVQVAGESITGPLLVTAPPPLVPRVSAASPSAGKRGRRTAVSIVGQDTAFQTGVSVLSFGGNGITVDSVTVTGPTSIVAVITIATTATLGFRDIVVTTGSESAVLLNGFNVSDPAGTPTALVFGATKQGANGSLHALTPRQTVTVSYAGITGSTGWTATADQPWIEVVGGVGTGAGRFEVGIVNPGNVIGASTLLDGTVTISAPGQSVTDTVLVRLLVQQSTTASAPPFGQVDSPAQNSAGVVGAMSITGWVLDDVGVDRVEIFRQCLGFEQTQSPSPCAVINGVNLVFLGRATFVPGARPDVEISQTSVPANHLAGWGFLVLTNMLPHIPSGAPNGGQGTMQFHVLATDRDGRRAFLGRSRTDQTPTTVTMANDTIARPFGNIDTPGQGATASGPAFANFGWVLTPDPGSGVLVPTNGSTINVFVDGAIAGTAVYNHCRGTVGTPPPAGVLCNDDVSSRFRGTGTRFRNLDAGRGPIAVRVVDTTLLSNGLHTISWGVTDSANRAEGIGSRFFTVLNASSADAGATDQAMDRPLGDSPTDDSKPWSRDALWGRTGFDLNTAFVPLTIGADGYGRARIPELGRLEIHVPGARRAVLMANGEARNLPVGAAFDLKTETFTWAPPSGYLGSYRLLFEREHDRHRVEVRVGGSESAPAIRMHLDSPKPLSIWPGPVVVGGWALDANAWTGNGIGAVHVWASRRDQSEGNSYTFLGTAVLGGARPDVAVAHGDSFGSSGFGLSASLPPGEYDIIAFVWSLQTLRFEDARSVRIVVR